MAAPVASIARPMARGASPMALLAQSAARHLSVSVPNQQAQPAYAAPVSSVPVPSSGLAMPPLARSVAQSVPPSAAAAASAAAGERKSVPPPSRRVMYAHGSSKSDADFERRWKSAFPEDFHEGDRGDVNAEWSDHLRRYKEKHHGQSSWSDEPDVAPNSGASRRVLYTRPVRMRSSAFCRVTRSYESTFPLTGQAPNNPNTAGIYSTPWLAMFPGNWNTGSSTDGVFAASTTVNEFDGVAFSLNFTKASVTGVTDATGPRMVRGGPTAIATAGSPVTSHMTSGGGWAEWNQDFVQFSNIFRYSKLDKLELRIKMPNITRGTDPGVNATTWTNQNGNMDLGVLYVAPWAGEPGVVNNYVTGNGALVNSFTNGNTAPLDWERMPGVIKVPLLSDRNDNPFRIITVPIKPVQPIVEIQSDASGQPILTGDEVVQYQSMPAVDIYAFIADEASHSCFGFKMFWSHPELAGVVTSQTNMPPWIEVNFRATMTWWGLLNPDASAGAALETPLLSLCKLPGADQVLLNHVADVRAQQQQDKEQLAQQVGVLSRQLARPGRPLDQSGAAAADDTDDMDDVVLVSKKRKAAQ